MSLRIVRPGLLTTVQDLGRIGSGALGVPPCGAMDPWALRAANRLVGNDDTDAGLEITLIGPEIRLEADHVLAICGSRFDADLDRSETPHAAAFVARAGQMLRLGKSREGARTYVAVRGGIDVPKVLDSRSTYLTAGWGGFAGRALRADDVLPVAPANGIARPRRLRSLESYCSEQSLRVIIGPQEEAFSSGGLGAFLSSTYRVSPRSDRMGLRLEGPPIDRIRPADIVPEGLAAGSIQVPADGQPIILAADRPVTGGYTKIATVVSADLARVGQAKPGDRLRFVAIDVAAARALWRDREAVLESGAAEIS
jgi:antagonist of KipI